jgi:hypothetical protein
MSRPFRQKLPPPTGGFDKIVVYETSSNYYAPIPKKIRTASDQRDGAAAEDRRGTFRFRTAANRQQINQI